MVKYYYKKAILILKIDSKTNQQIAHNLALEGMEFMTQRLCIKL